MSNGESLLVLIISRRVQEHFSLRWHCLIVFLNTETENKEEEISEDKKDSHLLVLNSRNYILFTFTSSHFLLSTRFCQPLKYFPWHCYYTNFSQHSGKMSWHIRSWSQTFQSREKHPLQKQPFQKTASSYQDRCLFLSLLSYVQEWHGSMLMVSLLLYCCDLSYLPFQGIDFVFCRNICYV